MSIVSEDETEDEKKQVIEYPIITVAVSMQPPYAHLAAYGIKKCENRKSIPKALKNASTNPVDIFIHQSKTLPSKTKLLERVTKDEKTKAFCMKLVGNLNGKDIYAYFKKTRGLIIGKVSIVDTKYVTSANKMSLKHDYHYFDCLSNYGTKAVWIMDSPLVLDAGKPGPDGKPMNGQLGLWNVPKELQDLLGRTPGAAISPTEKVASPYNSDDNILLSMDS